MSITTIDYIHISQNVNKIADFFRLIRKELTFVNDLSIFIRAVFNFC